MRGCFSAHAFINFWGCLNISAKELQINEEIRDKELRIISSDGEQLGIMSASEALRIAEERDLDLVKISPQAKPPVCKIMDYGKYKFENVYGSSSYVYEQDGSFCVWQNYYNSKFCKVR